MKKQNIVRLLSWSLIVVIPFWFGSCSKKDGSVTPTSSSLEGTWVISGLKIDPAYDLTGTGKKSNDLLAAYSVILGADFSTCLTTTKITFVAGGKLTQTPGSKCSTSSTTVNIASSSSTWKLDGSKLTITDSTGSEVYDTVISGNTLKMSQTDSTTDYDGDGKKDTVTLSVELTKA